MIDLSDKDKLITIYTDGASSGNPGPGGYGTILDFKGKRKELSEGFRLTTNNRMELLAVIKGLQAIKANPDFKWNVLIVSDSKYVIDAVEKKWVFGWKQKGFAGKKNPDLWTDFLNLYPLYHIQFRWIKGHNGHPENERCDELAVEAAKNPKFRDLKYENLYHNK